MNIRLILIYHITIGKQVIIHLLFSLTITTFQPVLNLPCWSEVVTMTTKATFQWVVP